MRNPTRLIRILLTAWTAAALLLACNAAPVEYSSGIVYNGFGEVTCITSYGYFEITRDDGALLRVTEYNGTKEIGRTGLLQIQHPLRRRGLHGARHGTGDLRHPSARLQQPPYGTHHPEKLPAGRRPAPERQPRPRPDPRRYGRLLGQLHQHRLRVFPL